jgi:hypothetical protein
MSPRSLLRLEGAVVLLAAAFGYALLGVSWWFFVGLLLVPDAFMAGYLRGPRVGALLYNVGHTYVLPLVLGAVALGVGSVPVGAAALIWTAHIGMDRALGYGLKHPSGFHDTHLSRPNPDAAARDVPRRSAARDALRPTAVLLLAVGLAACQPSPPLDAGRWTGTLTPMNHPDMATPVAYDVRYDGGRLAVDLIGPNGTTTSTHAPRLVGDTLFFSFDEPEEQVRLDCALGRSDTGTYAGRCVDPSGKWARFTMVAPPTS